MHDTGDNITNSIVVSPSSARVGLFLGPVVLVFVMHFGRIVVPELVSARQIRPTGVDPSHLTEPAGTSAGASGGDSTPSTGETAGADSPGDPPTGDDVDPSTD